MRTEHGLSAPRPALNRISAAAAVLGVFAMLTGPVLAEDHKVAAPGRVEPKSGEIRIGSSVQIGRVEEVLVSVNSVVEEGELLVRLDDSEARANLAAAEAEAGAAKRARDDAPVTSGREDAMTAEDNLFKAETDFNGARLALDEVLKAKRRGTATELALAEARKRLSDARSKLTKEKFAFATAQAKPNLVAPGPAESALTAARAKVTMAAALLDKTRIRSPISGTVLEVNAKAGEIVAPSAEFPLIVLGDMSLLRVKAEVDDGSVAKIKRRQKAFVRSINWPNRKFTGTVSAIAPTMAAPRIIRGPRLPSDIEVLEVTIDLDPIQDDNIRLLPGMRVDAFFE